MYKIPPIEEVFSSKGRIKILKVLVDTDSINISKIVTLTRNNSKLVNQHLNYLKELGIVEETCYGRRIKIYRLSSDHPIASLIKKTILDWEITQKVKDDKK